MRTSRNRTIAAALVELNVIRALYDMPKLQTMPKGEIQEPFSCPVANGLEGTDVAEGLGGVSVSSEQIGVGDRSFNTPPAIARFVDAFDNRRYPHLVA